MLVAMQIDVVSDTICPWCFIGKRKLEQALAQRPDLDIEVLWHPFQLDPNVPKEGVDRKAYMAAKFGDNPPRGAGEAIRQYGEELGIPFAFEKQDKRPNTIDSHRLIRWAGGVGVQGAVVEALFQAYFVEGRDIGDAMVLREIAEQCGMDGELVGDMLASDADVQMVMRESMAAHEMGLTGVPGFLIDSRFLISGAQDPAYLLRAIDKAMETRGARPASS